MDFFLFGSILLAAVPLSKVRFQYHCTSGCGMLNTLSALSHNDSYSKYVSVKVISPCFLTIELVRYKKLFSAR
ncbi:uncharacterized protein BDW43DRAFT_281082 [Aspergillus alliaceus]|uniref:uncharacterized protein n=1 Tax=Petromyces alliaceus TaxID=209559 RepID=UPI0012A5A2DA|nr:uncharacterized protein BDW43DRAFT_281082 [Aspergillus alliaceus]KAB8231924.1 hypothetical protein BDW43DRAFT_281082 [Aspergillus alliaceus]